MPNILSFSEDMLPRHFPRAHFLKATEQSEQISVLPQPTLPGVSLIFSSEKNCPRIEPKKSFQKWKEQHQAILTNKTTDHKVKTVKKHVTFETKDHFERSVPVQRIQPIVNPKLELSNYESPNSKGTSDFYQCSNIFERSNLHHQNKLYQTQRKFHKPNISSNSGVTLSSEFANNNRSQTNVNLHQYVSVQRSESMKENCFYGARAMGHNNQKQLKSTNSTWCHSNPCCCQSSENYFQNENDEVFNRTEQGSNGIPERQQTVQELQPSVNILINILEEQQQHLLLQQNQISEQQKQICTLQYQLQQLLELNEAIDALSPVKDHKSMIPNEITREVMLQTGNGFHVTPSIGVMTSFLDKVNDKRTTLSPGTSHKYSCQDNWLDQTNANIRNSTDFIDYGINESYPNRHSDTNISQTLIYGALSTNNSYVNSQKEIDRSYYLNMLGMKYKCTESDSPLYTDEQGVYNNEFNIDVKSDRLREDLPSDTYDYLIRHGLMKR